MWGCDVYYTGVKERRKINIETIQKLYYAQKIKWSNSLKTFTNSWRGLRNPEMDKIMNEFKEECQPIINKYINIIVAFKT